VQGSAFSGVSLGEIGVEADACVGVFEGVGGVVFGEVGCGSVGVVDVVGAVEVDGVGVVLDCFREVFGHEGFVPECFVLLWDWIRLVGWLDGHGCEYELS